MISTLLPAARSRMERVTRRDFMVMVGSAAAMKAADVAFDRLVVDPAVEAAAPSDPLPHMRMDLGIDAFNRIAAPNQRAAWDGLKLTESIPDHAAGRCTFVEERDGDMWVLEQGHEAAGILWGKPTDPGRMADQPDRTFGRWRAECIRAAARKTEPTYELVRAVVNGRVHRYTALVVPGPTIKVVTASDTPAPARESMALSRHPGIA